MKKILFLSSRSPSLNIFMLKVQAIMLKIKIWRTKISFPRIHQAILKQDRRAVLCKKWTKIWRNLYKSFSKERIKVFSQKQLIKKNTHIRYFLDLFSIKKEIKNYKGKIKMTSLNFFKEVGYKLKFPRWYKELAGIKNKSNRLALKLIY